jgi:hypothetical protein
MWAVRASSSTVATLGQQATLQIVPERGYAQVVLTNASRGAELHGWLSAGLLHEHLGLESPTPEPRDQPPESLAELVGRYEAVLATVDVATNGGHLVIQSRPKGGFPTTGSPPGPTPPPTHFGVWSADHIIGLAPPFKGARADFVRDARGRVAYLRFGGRLAKRQ